MKRLLLFLWGTVASFCVFPREINVRIWISGGTEDMVLGNRECPGWLSLSRQLQLEDPDALWIHVGCPPLSREVLDHPDLKVPDILIPAEQDFRLRGREALEKTKWPLLISNADRLPQFPGYTSPFPESAEWEQPDGVQVNVYGFLSMQAPLRIPSDRLRPLRIVSPEEKLRNMMIDAPVSERTFPIAVLPEDADAPMWSKRFPGIPLLIMPPAGAASVVEVHRGTQLRIRPARWGRSFVRVDLYWDTVKRTFRNPVAETVWVHPPELQGVELPEEMREHLHPLREWTEKHPEEILLDLADAVMCTELNPGKVESSLPDAVRRYKVPENHAWFETVLPRSLWEEWKKEPGVTVLEKERPGPEVRAWISARVVAGNGNWDSAVRQDILKGKAGGEWVKQTTRDLVVQRRE